MRDLYNNSPLGSMGLVVILLVILFEVFLAIGSFRDAGRSRPDFKLVRRHRNSGYFCSFIAGLICVLAYVSYTNSIHDLASKQRASEELAEAPE